MKNFALLLTMSDGSTNSVSIFGMDADSAFASVCILFKGFPVHPVSFVSLGSVDVEECERDHAEFMASAPDPESYPCDDLNPAYILSGQWTALLVDIVSGKIDMVKLAKRELESRGMDASGVWVGFDKTIK